MKAGIANCCECAMRGGVSVSVHLHVRVGTAKGEDGEDLRVFVKKEGRR